MTGHLLLGFGCVDVTPPVGTHLCGFVARQDTASSVHDPLFARALVVADPHESVTTALVVCDVIGFDIDQAAQIRRRVEDATGIDRAHTVVTATHTHGGPPVMPGRLGGGTDPDYLEQLIQGAVEAVRQAFRRRRPAVLRHGIGHESAVAHNRRIPDGVVDPTVHVVRAESAADGRVLGILCTYACHPVTLGPDNLDLTADYPGYVVRTLEDIYQGAVAVFATGCAGQINTGHAAHDSLDSRGATHRSFGEAQRIGRSLAAAAAQAAEQAAGPRADPVAVAPSSEVAHQVRTGSVAVTMRMQATASVSELTQQARDWRDQARHAPPSKALVLESWARWASQVAEDNKPEPRVEARVTAMRWGSITLIALPGEPFVELGLEIQRRIRRPCIVLGYADGCPGYVPHRSAYAYGGYEVGEAHRFYGQPAAFTPDTGEILVAAAARATELIHTHRETRGTSTAP